MNDKPDLTIFISSCDKLLSDKLQLFHKAGPRPRA